MSSPGSKSFFPKSVSTVSSRRSDARGFDCVIKRHDRPRPKLVLGGYDEEPHLRKNHDKPAYIINYAKPYLVIRSSDGQTFQVDELACMESTCLNDDITWMPCGWTYVRLTSFILEKVVHFIENHAHLRNSNDNQKLKDFHSEFFKQNHTLHFELMEAAYKLGIKSLFDLTSDVVADMLTGKSREETLKFFNLKNGFTLQEMAAIREEEDWFY